MLPVCYDPYVGTLGRFSRAEIFDLVAKAGYEGINVPVNRPFLGDLSSDEIEDVARLAERYELVVPTVGFGNHILTNPKLRSEAMRHFEVVLDVALKLNAGIIGIWPNQPENASREEALETLRENLAEMLPALEEHGLKIALEFEKGCPLDNYREGIEFIEGTDFRLKLTCDTYHLFNDRADPYQAAIAMGEKLGDVHVSGSHRGEPGTGEFDFESFAKGLREINFKGPLVVQYRMQDVESIARSCQFTRRFREMILG
ncbi:TPA: sugar phosphate isomerase/epimerase [Candidatus Poribacteria bacterium]|nr:sugar phosphate isomerase/epimerase [Candidatus Poribacteria bacterium]